MMEKMGKWENGKVHLSKVTATCGSMRKYDEILQYFSKDFLIAMVAEMEPATMMYYFLERVATKTSSLECRPRYKSLFI